MTRTQRAPRGSRTRPTREAPHAAPPIDASVQDLLDRAVAEVARLLDVDGAMAYLVEPDRRMLRFAADAGISRPEVQELIRDLILPIGVGLFGTAVERREVVMTGDYRKDERFSHSDVADRIARLGNMRSMVVAPMVAEGEALGGIGAYSSRIDGFAPAQVGLLRALADHAAAAIWNRRLIERLNRSQAELAQRVEAQQTLGRIASRIAVIRNPDEVLQQVVDSARRLLGSNGAHLTLLDPEARVLRPTVMAGATEAATREWLGSQAFPLDGGINGLAAGRSEVIATTDYRLDDRIPHEPGDDETAERMGLRGMAAAPLRAPEGAVIGTLAVSFEEPHEFKSDELALLQGLADQGAIAIANARLTDELRQQATRLARRVETQRALAEMAAQITSLRDPITVLAETLGEAVRLLRADGGQIGVIASGADGVPRWGQGHSWIDGRTVPFTEADRTTIGHGISGQAVRERRTIWTDDYLADPSFDHDPESDEYVRSQSVRSVLAAPLSGDDGPIGCLAVTSTRERAFNGEDAELLTALAGHAAIVLSNARLYDAAQDANERLAQRVEAQRTLADIAAQITSLHDPSAVLRRTVEETKRLLAADHVVIHQVRAGTHELADYRAAFAADPDAPPVDDVAITVGQGIAGRAVADRTVVRTGNYLADSSFEHASAADDWIRRHGYQSQMSAPLVGDAGPLGAITAYSMRREAFGSDESELLGALASHAAIVLGNVSLVHELERRVEAQRALGEIAARITALRDAGTVLQRTLDEAVRLLDADGGRIELVDEASGGLFWAFGHSAIDLPIERDEATDPVRADEGISGKAVTEARVVRTGDYLADQTFSHSEGPDRYVRQHGIRSAMVAPLIGEDGAIGSITVHSQARDAFDAQGEELLEVLAAQAAVAVTNARLYEELREQSGELARQIDSQRRLLAISERILSTLDPADVLETIADGLKRVVRYDNLGIYALEPGHDRLRPVLARDRNAEAVLGFPIPRGQGLTWWAVEKREPVRINDALSDERVIQIPGTPADPEAIIIVPLVARDEVVGAMNLGRVGGAEVGFTDGDFELVQLFAAQAAVAITNARLYAELRERADAQRSLAEIAAQIASLHEPQTVLQRAVADAARLLGADRAQVNLRSDDGTHLEQPIAAAPDPPSPDDVIVPLGSGIAGLAATERRVMRTGDYLADTSFPHDEGDERIRAQGIRSMMAAPLIGPDDLIGTITVQSTNADAFGEGDAELLKLLADQAAIAVTNTRLYEQLEQSEARYRFLIDNSPDIVWSIDGEGRFTFLSDSLEARTGWKPQDLIGKPFSVLTDQGGQAAALLAWTRVREAPGEEHRVRLDLPLANGLVSPAEIALTGTMIDGKFAGAHGSVRDISERERLEGDLRRQAGELAASQERAHLARELHDSVTQALFSMGLTMRSLELLMASDPDAARGKLAELRELQKDALAEMRTLIFELRPASLETDGLAQALRHHATAAQGRTGLAIAFDAELIDRLPLPVEEALYRIGQEALHNVVKHANASRAAIRIRRDGNAIRLEVEDDGDGFDPDAVPRGHLGLIGMRQRADLVGAEMTVHSTKGSGTLIEVSVPMEGSSAE